MTTTDDVLRIREHALDYLRPAAIGLSPDGLIMELVALSTVESFLSDYRVSITVELTDSHSATLRDTGRGMRLEPDPGSQIDHAQQALTTIYPIGVDDVNLMATLRDWVWEERGSLGPVVVNAMCEQLVMTSSRDGEIWAQYYDRGVPRGLAQKQGVTSESGTRIDLIADPEIFEGTTFDPQRLDRCFDKLRGALPRLDLTRL